MHERERATILCLASYEKGAEFLQEARRQGARVLLVALESLAGAEWPRESIDGLYFVPDLYAREAVLNAVAYLGRAEDFDRIVALDEFDLEMAATLREHLRVPGLAETATRVFRDKLVMREAARGADIPVPEFTPLFSHGRLAAFLQSVAPPWVLKPRTQASAIGIRKIADADECWRALEQLGDDQSRYLLESYVAGDVYHVDSIVAGGAVVFAEAHRYQAPPFDVMHGGGVFCSRTLSRGSAEEATLLALNERVASALGLPGGALHTEFIRSRADGEFFFLETAARVGGANIVDMVEAATGVNLWREWARLEVAAARGRAYTPPEPRADYGGVLITLARQEWPDTSSFTDAEIVLRIHKRHHAGFVLRATDSARLDALLSDYMDRFMTEFHAALPAPDRPTA